MRRKLISALATRFEGVEAKTLGRIADRLMSDKTIETDEDVNSAVEEVTFAEILKSYGDSRAAEATKSAVSNYEKKHGLKNGKPTEAQTDPDDDGDADTDPDEDGDGSAQKKSGKSNAKKGAPTSTNPEIAALMKSVQAMAESMKSVNDELQSLKKGRVTETRKARLAEVIKGLRDSQKKAYNRLPLDSYTDEEFESFIDEVTGEVAELDKENKAEGGSFGAPLSGGGSGSPKGEASDSEISAVVEGFNL